LTPEFKKDINQIHFPNTLVAERISTLDEKGSKNHIQMRDDIYAIHDMATALESQVAINTQGIEDIHAA
jgi:hypothetical protein